MKFGWTRPIGVILFAVTLSACSAEQEPSTPVGPESAKKAAEHVAEGGAAKPGMARENMMVSHVWARPTMAPGQPGGAYFTITNHTMMDDRLYAVSSPRADRVEMHDNQHEGNVMRMIRLEEVLVAAGSTVQFAPGGKHVMLFGLDAPLKAGETVPLKLHFDHAGDVELVAKVSQGMSAPETEHHGAH